MTASLQNRDFGTNLQLSAEGLPHGKEPKARTRLETLMNSKEISWEEMLELDKICGTPTLEQEAYLAYKKGVERNGEEYRPPFGFFLHMENLRIFRAAVIRYEGVPRSLSTEELNLLVGEDIEFTCFATEKKTKGVWWIEPFNELLDEIEKVGLEEAKENLFDKIYEFGAFYTLPGKDINSEVFGFSGPAYFILKQGNNFRPVPSNRSPLGKAQMNHPQQFWGLSMKEIEKRRQMKKDAIAAAEMERQAKLAQRAQQGKKVDDKIANFFGTNERLVMNEPRVRNARPQQGGGCK
ncbi:MAG: hypothetical protein RJA61_281 [Candidatus Parcubacteria bacterium]|jgi:hypothetical protein